MPVVIFNNETAGPTLEIGISLTDPNQVAGVPPANTVWTRAIADTGATQTCICASVASRAGLPIVGIGQMQSASHIIPVNLYFGTLWIKAIVQGSPFSWNFAARPFMELGLPGNAHEALLGMDILGFGILSLNGLEKKTSFSW